MVLAAVFVLLSQWQFSRSQDAAPPPPSTTEQVVPLTDVFSPGIPLTATVADQMVRMEGEFVPETRVLIQNRLQDDRAGFWVVSAFAVDGVSQTNSDGQDTATVIPVVHGWVPDATAGEGVPLAAGSAVVVGRLLPTEAPIAERPVAGQVPSLSVAQLINRWDVSAFAGFVVSSEITADGAVVAPVPPLEPVIVGPQPQETPLNWLNIFYALEWVVFAGFAFFLWWRLVADDHRRTLEEREDENQDADGDDPDDADGNDGADGDNQNIAPAHSGGQKREVRW